MSIRARPPAPVLTVVALFGLFAVLSLVAAVVSLAGDGFGENFAAGAFGTILCGLIALRLWFGAGIARGFAIAVAVFLLITGFWQASTIGVLIFFVALGGAIIALLTAPRSSREFFAGHRRASVA
jgi:hypothetical protein